MAKNQDKKNVKKVNNRVDDPTMANLVESVNALFDPNQSESIDEVIDNEDDVDSKPTPRKRINESDMMPSGNRKRPVARFEEEDSTVDDEDMSDDEDLDLPSDEDCESEGCVKEEDEEEDSLDDEEMSDDDSELEDVSDDEDFSGSEDEDFSDSEEIPNEDDPDNYTDYEPFDKDNTNAPAEEPEEDSIDEVSDDDLPVEDDMPEDDEDAELETEGKKSDSEDDEDVIDDTEDSDEETNDEGESTEDEDLVDDAALEDSDEESSKKSKKKEDEEIEEQVMQVFKDSGLSEKDIKKIKTVYKASVNTKVNGMKKNLVENANKALQKKVGQINRNVDRYLSYVAEEYCNQNKLAIETGLRTELYESFIEGMKQLFEEHYITIPKGKDNLVHKLEGAIKLSQKKLNEEVNKNVKLTGLVKKLQKALVIAEEAKGLSDIQSDTLVNLSESIGEFDNMKDLRSRVRILKNELIAKKAQAIKKPVKKTTRELEESVQPVDLTVDPNIQRLAENLGRFGETI